MSAFKCASTSDTPWLHVMIIVIKTLYYRLCGLCLCFFDYQHTLPKFLKQREKRFVTAWLFFKQ